MKAVLREKQRYIGVLVFADRPDRTLIQNAIQKELVHILGQLTFARADPKLVYLSHDSRSAVIRCTTQEVDNVRAGLSLVTHIDHDKPIHLMPIFTSGTILKCKRACAKAEKSLGTD